jgi:hypothetical protein
MENSGEKEDKKLLKSPKQNRKPSGFQLFFWRIAGSEITILEKCPTDWNKHVGIGMAIFMTTVLAFFSGSYAAYFFTESLIASSAFGFLWAALIYSIDRSLVVTLKKTPDKKPQEYVIPFLLRGALAGIIAFVISIPLELLIFEENIEIHMTPYKQKQVARTIDYASTNIQNTEDKKDIRNLDSTNYAIASQKLKLQEPDTDDYKELKNNVNRLKRKLKVEFSDLTQKAKFKSSITSQDDPNYGRLWFKYNNLLGKENKFIRDSVSPSEKRMFEYSKNWRNDWKNDSIKYKSNLDNISEILLNDLLQRGRIAQNQDSLLKNKKGFVLKFMILEDLASGKTTQENPEGYIMWVLLWLIRCIFILIELLPTIVKTVTPLGNYDLALWAEEQNFAKSLSDGEQEYREHQSRLRRLEQETLEQQAKDRNEIQEELNKTLLKEIALAQDLVAREKIAEYKEKHLKK